MKLDDLKEELQNYEIDSDIYNMKASRCKKIEQKIQEYMDLDIQSVDTALANYPRYKGQLKKYRK